ncbi:MAG: hypothetical protein AAFV53_02165 [Myxococcota bacterium]
MTPTTIKLVRTHIMELEPGRGRMFFYFEMGGRPLLQVPKPDFSMDGPAFEDGKLPEKLEQRLTKQLNDILKRDPKSKGCAGVVYLVGKKYGFRVHRKKKLPTRAFKTGLKQLEALLKLKGLKAISAPRPPKPEAE